MTRPTRPRSARDRRPVPPPRREVGEEAADAVDRMVDRVVGGRRPSAAACGLLRFAAAVLQVAADRGAAPAALAARLEGRALLDALERWSADPTTPTESEVSDEPAPNRP